MSAVPASSSTKSASADESQLIIPLVGQVSGEIVGTDLPSKKQALKFLFYHVRIGKQSVRESAKLVLKAILPIWEKARIPTKSERGCLNQIEKLHAKWTVVRAKASTQSESQKKKEEAFIKELDELLDIAQADALQTMKNKKDKEFLEAQRMKNGQSGPAEGEGASDQKQATRRKRKHQ